MISPDSIGRTFAGSDLATVTQSQIDAFCAVIGESDTSVAPPTFSIRITLDQSQKILSDPAIGLDWTRVVHGDQRFEIKSPIKAGDSFSCTSTIESAKAIAGNEIVTVRSDLSKDGAIAVSTWSTLVVRG
jgi:hydroxyacyl-ACP dehydratase HTD2-like protein with hotdog domain